MVELREQTIANHLDTDALGRLVKQGPLIDQFVK